MSQLSDIISQINQLTGYNVPTSSNIIISQSAMPVGSGSVNQIINYINGLTGFNIPSTNVQFVSGSNVAGPVVVYIQPSPGGTIPTEGIQPGAIIRAEHILRIIYALSGVSVDDIIISGSLSTSGSNTFDGNLSLPFIPNNQFLYTSGGYVVGVTTPPSASFAETASYALTASFAPDYTPVITFNTFTSSYNTGSFSGSFIGLLQGTASWAVSASQALTASFAPAYLLIAQTGSMLQPYLLINDTGSMLQPYVLTSTTASMLSPYLPIAVTSSMTVLSSSFATTASYALNIPVIDLSGYVTTSSFNNFTSSYNTGSFSGSFTGDGSGLINIPTQSIDTGSLVTTSSFNAFTGSVITTGSIGLSQSITGSLGITGSTVINGNVTIHGTASVSFLDVTVVSASVIYSSGSNILGDATNDTQRLIGTVIVSGSQQITGSLTAPNITGSLDGTASWANNVATASAILGGKAPHVPYFITDTTLATSSIYQSGSTSVIINQDNNTTANPEALYVWQPSTTSFNVISGKGNLDNYLQLNIQNTNQGTIASSDVVATANNGNEGGYYIDMGINSENYSGFIGGPNDAYLYATGSHLHIGNATPNKPLQFFVGGPDTDADRKLELNSNNQHNVTGSLEISDSLKVNQGITGSLQGLATSASYAITASYVQTAQTASYVAAANVVGTVTSASHAINADNAQNAVNATFATTAGNGGVTQIVAGTGVSLIPTSGLGAVTVIATGVGGVTIISGSNVTESFNNSTTWNFQHNLGTRVPIITVFDTSYNQIIPQNIELVDTASATITFPTAESGFAIASLGGATGTVLSSSYALLSTYADTASYYIETDPIFVAKSGSLATTGSNIFRGNQTITGSLIVSSSAAFTSVGSSVFSGSVTLVSGATGSLFGTASYVSGSIFTSTNPALSASFATTASYTLNALSSSYAQTASYGINMIVSGGIASASYIDFNLNPGVADAIGRLKFDSGEGTLQLGLAGGNVTANIGEDLFQYVYNSTGAPLTKGQVVYISGSQGNRIAVKLASAVAEQGSANTLGFTAEAIAAGSEGWVQTEGTLRKLNTVGLVGGQLIYLSTTPGAYTQTPPTAPNQGVRLGYAERIDNTQGSIYIKVDNGYEIGELHDVVDTTTTSSFGDLLVKSGSVWINSKQLSGSYGITGSLTISGSTTFTNIGPAVFTGSVGITGSTIQTGNNTLIGNTILSGSIDISGSQTFTGTSISIGNQIVTGSLLTSGSQTLIGNTILSGSIGVSGSQTFYGTSAFYGNHTLSGSNTIQGNTVMSGSIEVSGSSNFRNTSFIVTGSTFFTGSFNVKGTSRFEDTSMTLTGSLLVSGSQIFNGVITVTGSQLFSGSSFINGATTITGSLNVFNGDINVVSGSSFTRWGNKLFNYAQFANTASIPVTQNVSASFSFPLTYFNDGVSIVSNSRITFANSGLYNIQYVATANQGVGTPNLNLWFKKTGSNIDNSRALVQLQNNSQTALTYNFACPISASEYIELWYHSSTANTSFPYSAAGSGFPASPSIVLTVTQIA